MSEDSPQRYQPGDVVNGHVLGADGRWTPVSPPGYQQPGYQHPGHTPYGFAPAAGHQYQPAPGQHYKPGAVVNGYVLNEDYEWEPLTEEAHVARDGKHPPAWLAVGSSGFALLFPIFGTFLFGTLLGIVGVALGAQVVRSKAQKTNLDHVLGIIAIVIGVLAVVSPVWRF